MTTNQPSLRLLHLDILAAAMILTRIPVHWPEDTSPETTRCYWAFPLIGLGVVVIPALLSGVLLYWGTPPLAAGMLTLAGIAFLTGGLHQDGLVDVADGLGGKDPKARLRIMRDSSIGSYGILALLSVSIVSVSCLAAIAAEGAFAMIYAMISAAALSRAMMAVQRHLHSPPDDTGLASKTGRPSDITTIIAVLVGMVVCASFSGVIVTFMLTLIGLAITVLLGRFLVNLVGGVNGDGLGTTQQLAEAAMLIILAMAAG
jgi:adenosylcobinamide-GDP ribazoletransferase